MTEQQIRDAATAAVADFPPIPDEVVARLGALLQPLNYPDDQPAQGGDPHADQAA